MRTQATDSLAEWPADLRPHRGVLVLSGYGLDVRVWHGRLRVADGIGHDRRQGLIHRATGGLRRLIVLGHTGSITLEAVRWLADVGAGYLQIDAALLEGEAAIAARIVGLDPGLGVLHADQPSRDSLAADLMEPVRPVVDRFVLGLLADRYFAAADFHETRQGVCRVTPGLAADLAATSPVWARAVGRVAEDVADLMTYPEGPASVTPITGRRRAAARPGGARIRPAVRPRTPRGDGCTTCGAATQPGRRTCSADCAKVARAENETAVVAAGTRSLEALRQADSSRR
jgi:hypothetical protein